jgi:hypothetical protein
MRKRQKYADVWPIDERAAKKPEGWQGWPKEKQFALVLTHDVDTQRGHDRCRMLAEMEITTGFRSSFNFVPERYKVDTELRHYLSGNGFEVGVHGLCHDAKYFNLREEFGMRAKKINNYLREWEAVGYRSPSMLRNLKWFQDLDIQYDSSTFDTDPFEPQSEGMGTIFPFFVQEDASQKAYVELPYTLPQDFTLFVLMQERNIEIWKRKLDWIVENGGMALLITHPDYMNFKKGRCGFEEYPVGFYEEFIDYMNRKNKGQYWNLLPKEMARFWLERTHG